MVFSQLLQILLRFYAKGAAMFKKILLTVLLVLAATPCFGYGESSVQAGPRPFFKQLLDPPALSNTGWVYTKEVAGIVELFYEDNLGQATQIVKDGKIVGGVVTTTLADDASVDIDSATSGWGEVFVGDNEERVRFSWTTAGVVTLMENTSNVVSSDTDGKFCIFDNGTSVRIRNRLGSPKTVKYVLNI